VTRWHAIVRRGMMHGAAGAAISFAVCTACVLWSPTTRTVADKVDDQHSRFAPRTEYALGWSCRDTVGPVNHWDQCGQPIPAWYHAHVAAGLPFVMMVGDWRDADSRDTIPRVSLLRNIEYRFYPNRVVVSGLLGNSAAYGLASFGLTALIAVPVRSIRVAIRSRQARCRCCGYDVLDLAVCPECGSPGRAASDRVSAKAHSAQGATP
jgi:hypothetical protein